MECTTSAPALLHATTDSVNSSIWSYGNVSLSLREWSTMHGISRISDQRSEMPVLLNKGQIERMRMPGGWVNPDSSVGAGSSCASMVQFEAGDASAAKITIHYNGLPLAKNDGQPFLSILEKSAHHLSPPEIRSLRPILRERANPNVFKILWAATLDLNGKRVLAIQGRYCQTEHYIYEIFVADTSSGAVDVQEIYLQAPEREFHRFLGYAKKAFQSIKWKAA
ncbi:MAG TPA: hypothetical protein V6C72_18335 [Chroococcales cyanobacterium]